MTRAETIQAAFEKHGSDKAIHKYAEFYAEHLPENPKSILEIGVKEGASIRAWKELFPDAIIHGLDLFLEYDIPMIEGAYFWKGNQLDWRILEQLRRLEFELIIEDGSHNARDQLITFFGLYNGKQKYFIEDIQCNYEEFYRDGLPINLTASKLLSGVHDSKSPIMLIC